MGLASEDGGGAMGAAFPVEEGVGLEDKTAEVQERVERLGLVIVECGGGDVGGWFGVHLLCFWCGAIAPADRTIYHVASKSQAGKG